MSKEFLSNLVHYRTYAKYLPENSRRENKNETIARYIKMMTDKFPNLKEEIEKAGEQIYAGRVVGSMRAMQFAGDPIFRRNNRMFNCSYLPIKSFRDFADLFYQSMSGCGVGFSVRKLHVSQLPVIQEGKVVPPFVIEDSAEGWCDSFLALMDNPDVQFDYTKIRLLGTPLTSGGTASGPKALIHMHAKIREILRKAINRKLTPYECHRICCLIADCVVVGGVRRGALISLFDYDDEEILNCKSGAWYEKNPELARANNSAVVHKNDPEFDKKAGKVIDACFAGGQAEPGLSLTNSDDYGYNPCQPSWAKLLTKNGIRELEDIQIGEEIWSSEGWTKVINKWSTGVKKVYKYHTTAGTFYGTENHKLVSNGVKIEAKDCESIDIIEGEYKLDLILNPQDVLDGLLIGDGSIHKASNDLIILYIGDDDQDYFDSEISDLIGEKREGIGEYVYEVRDNTVTSGELPKTYEREIPDRFYYGNRNKVAGFLRGLYSANGSVVDKRITLKSASFKVIEQVQSMLSSLGIRSYYTTNKPKRVKFSNGEYDCRQSYDLNISSDRNKFMGLIGFIQKYKEEKAFLVIDKQNLKLSKPKKTYDIISIDLISEEEVFDITVDNSSHTYWTQGCNVSNCHEIALRDYGVCNLTEINAAACLSQEDWLKAVEVATIFGTLQASFTDFKYVQPQWKITAEEDSLLGVSITGQAENQAILTEENLQKGAALSVEINKLWADKIGIKPAKRITTTKPSGTSSSWLKTTAGVHAGHSLKYLRRVRMPDGSALAKALKRYFPAFIVQDPFSPTDLIMQVPIRLNENTILRNKETALQCLERTKFLFNNWIIKGHLEGLNSHNVSLTINYHPNEKEGIKEWMLKNKEFYNGISLIPYDGGDYQYLPYSQDMHEEFYKIIEQNFHICSAAFDFDKVREKKDYTDFKGESACAGGACELHI